MFLLETMSNSTSISEEASVSSETRVHDHFSLSSLLTSISPHQQPLPKTKKKRNQAGNPDPEAEVVALSPNTLMATNRFICEICNKGFQRDQNLQLHRRGHNLPWKLRQRSNKEGATRKRVYVCPEPSCVHHHPCRALGDLTGIKKHFSRKHGEKKWKCDKCSKRYAVHSDWKAHVKTCGTREYRCDCGTLFTRKDSFITHRAFCDALAEESARVMAGAAATPTFPPLHQPLFLPSSSSFWDPFTAANANLLILNPSPDDCNLRDLEVKKPEDNFPSLLHHLPTNPRPSPHLSATALLQKASAMGPISMTNTLSGPGYTDATAGSTVAASSSSNVQDLVMLQKTSDGWTRDFLGVAAGESGNDELLLDLVTASPCAPMGHPNKQFAGFHPVSGTWN
ncbi:protein indeterminate-domain 7-like [Zingiber officinale]|uniref:Protein EARLY HEADING DATE 2 n=1 Tax=Zingiber officinale TaxID=94328 RepID=A0A8J5HTG3_ZINOF|nr:protein indeterminate-domain 7-like [Zingiber officinale]KAG6524719.1 hypothetical protein ZIOFF_014657 [Zingiber officinale]